MMPPIIIDWVAAAAFLLSERARHWQDINDIDHKLALISAQHDIDIAEVRAADFLSEEGICR